MVRVRPRLLRKQVKQRRADRMGWQLRRHESDCVLSRLQEHEQTPNLKRLRRAGSMLICGPVIFICFSSGQASLSHRPRLQSRRRWASLDGKHLGVPPAVVPPSYGLYHIVRNRVADSTVLVEGMQPPCTLRPTLLKLGMRKTNLFPVPCPRQALNHGAQHTLQALGAGAAAGPVTKGLRWFMLGRV